MALNLSISGRSTIVSDGTYHISPAIVKASNGDWVLAYHKGTSHTDTPAIIFRRSSDQGASWSAEAELFNSAGLGLSGLVVTPSGAMLLIVGKTFGADPARYAAFARSEDNGLTWSAFQRFSDTSTAVYPSRFITVGSVLYTTIYTPDSRVELWKSADDGFSFSIVSEITGTAPAVQANETGLIQTGPTSLIAISRAADDQHTYQFHSDDLGVTWTAGKSIQAFLGNLDYPQLVNFGGAIILLARDHDASQMVGYSSSDNGESFSGKIVLDSYSSGFNQGGYCWPLDAGDGRLFLAYYSNSVSPAKPDIKSLFLSVAESGMALAVSNLTNGNSASSATSYTTASISPSIGNLLLVAVRNGQSGATTDKANVPQLSGDGITFNLLYTRPTQFNPANRFSVFWAIVPAGVSAGVITIAFTATQAAAGWSVDAVSGIDSTTPISWLVQAKADGAASGATSLTATLDTLQDTNSVCYGACYWNGTQAQLSPGSGFTQLSETAGAIATEYKVNDANVNWAHSISTGYNALALEITASNSGLRNNPLASHFLGCSGAGS